MLARREHSRAELERKLAPHADSPEELRRLLDDLEAQTLQSDSRYVESLARRRAERFGAARIREELRQRGVDVALVDTAFSELRRTELQRALDLWRRRFGAAAANRDERLRQMRFLAQRGFDAEVIRRVVNGRAED